MRNIKSFFFMLFCSCWLITLVCVQTVEAQERYRGMNVRHLLTAQDVNDLAALNVNIVRMQFAWHEAVQTATEEEFFTLLEEGLQNLDSLLPLFEQHNIKVIIDMHTPPGGFASKGTFPLFSVFQDPADAATLIEAWNRISQRYKNNPTIYAYEVLSEPATGTKKPNPQWPNLAKQLIDTVRQNDTSHPFLLGPDYGHFPKLKKFGSSMKNLMGQDDYQASVIHSIHPYLPPQYVRQGISTSKRIRYPTPRFNKRYLTRTLKKVKRAEKKLKVPVFVGEFSVSRAAPGAARYLRDLLKVFERNRWGWTYHIFRESDVWSVEHSNNLNDPNPVDGETDRLQVLRSFFQKNGS